MSVTIDLDNACPEHWTPDINQLRQWLAPVFDLTAVDHNITLSVCFVGESDGAELNRRYRGKQMATNVLSFPANIPSPLVEEMAQTPLGDIVICPPVLEREAAEQGKEAAAHWAHLTQHGLLHLLGYSHDNDQDTAIMENLEISALRKLGIANPYLIG